MNNWMAYLRVFFSKPKQEMIRAESGLIYSLIVAAPAVAIVIHRVFDVHIALASLVSFFGACAMLLVGLTAMYLWQK